MGVRVPRAWRQIFPIVPQLETKNKRSKIVFVVTSTALSLGRLRTQLLGLPAQSLIGSPSTLGGGMAASLKTAVVTLMMMIAFITIKSSLVPLIEDLCAQI